MQKLVCLGKIGSCRGKPHGGKFDAIYEFTPDLMNGDLAAAKNLQSQYPFLAYAYGYWLFHTKDLEEHKTKTWTL